MVTIATKSSRVQNLEKAVCISGNAFENVMIPFRLPPSESKKLDRADSFTLVKQSRRKLSSKQLYSPGKLTLCHILYMAEKMRKYTTLIRNTLRLGSFLCLMAYQTSWVIPYQTHPCKFALVLWHINHYSLIPNALLTHTHTHTHTHKHTHTHTHTHIYIYMICKRICW